MVSVVIPAHNEERGLARLLAALAAPAGAPPLEIVVVANGCTDATAQVARAAGVRVLDSPVPSKIEALRLGDAAVLSFPRLYVDADVLLPYQDALALAQALTAGVHAAGPTRRFPMAGVGWAVRAYYAVWQQLPGVRAELYGRGVLAVDAAGHARLTPWAEAMSDDLLIAMAFAPGESAVLPGATVTIWPPKTYRDLLRRRIRAMTGNAQLARAANAPRIRTSGASPRVLGRLMRQRPTAALAVGVFVATAALAKAGGRWARWRGHGAWLRDESSRT